ncbi:c-type cytochrome [Paraburkholderia dinghuensis]|uniref:Cytochrome c4 n=1 Tax=Paraburkholderia dinghuensis TaxID=2305225 RepID=A0A3N6ME38_9BURK|nr:c-type cytochrome [Paraburkholderia dinghuensis]RQH02224.1 cytochrome c4 [Paraburkholderia dinghuensis]
MNDDTLFSLRNPWFRAGVGASIVAFIVSVLIGFVWLPSVKTDPYFTGIWNAICSAAGVPRQWHPVESAIPPGYKVSTAQLTPHMLDNPTQLSIGRGATLGLRCSMCHGPQGISEANSPNLAGQPASSLYKQLHDFRSGVRVSAVMSPMARNLSDQDIRDLAAWYASLPRPVHVNGASPPIVAHGSPLRNIPACASCHGGIEFMVGAPSLDGLPAAYTKAQMLAFADGSRHNDNSEQMRNIARNMTLAEIDAAAAWFAGQPRP